MPNLLLNVYPSIIVMKLNKVAKTCARCLLLLISWASFVIRDIIIKGHKYIIIIYLTELFRA